jgi:beta-mannosidase
MGSLYWQLNDCWPVASWSGIDYFGRWKSLHHQAKEAYEPLLLSISENQDSVFVSLVSDQQNKVAGELEIELLNFEGENLFHLKMAAEFLGLTARKVWSSPKDQINGLRGNENSVVLAAKFKFIDQQEKETLHYFSRPKDLILPQPNIVWEMEEDKTRKVIRIQSDKLARQVYIQYDGTEEIRFEPNFFDLLPGQVKAITVFKRSRDHFDKASVRFSTINQFSSSTIK